MPRGQTGATGKTGQTGKRGEPGMSGRVTVDMGPIGDILQHFQKGLEAVTVSNENQGKLLVGLDRLVNGYKDDVTGKKVKGIDERLDNIYDFGRKAARMGGVIATFVVPAAGGLILKLLGFHTEQIPQHVVSGATAFWAQMLQGASPSP